MPFAFEKLLVYQKAVDFADAIAGLTESFPRGYGYLADQLNRASLSIAANLAEGNGRFANAGAAGRRYSGMTRSSGVGASRAHLSSVRLATIQRSRRA